MFIQKHRLLYFSAFGIFSSSIWAASYSPTHLTKLFYHQGIFGDKVVCYFDKAPICNFLPERDASKDDQEKKIEFFMPMAMLADGKARTMMHKINDTKSEHYSIKFQEEEKPVKGIKVCIAYNSSLIVCDYATCDSISAQKSLVFNFHHKKGLEAIQLHSGSILRQVSNHQKPRIMLDFGHGGEDDGKVGCNMIKEKDINIQVGMKLANLLRQKGYQVSLTRKADLFVPLDERTTTANQQRADVFVSLHSNAGYMPTISGIETYWTARNNLKREVLSGQKQTENIISGLYSELDSASKSLASLIHEQVITSISAKHSIVNRNVKQSVAQVLLGTDMPSALIEMGFLTNPTETKLLANHRYQSLLAQGICAGIESYCKSKKLI